MKNAPPSIKHFYSNEVHISINFNSAGGISGCLRHFPEKFSKLTYFGNGLYCEHTSRTTFTFFTESVKILTCYCGEIFKYFNNEECLLLKIWSTNELVPAPEIFCEHKYLLLFDTPVKDPVIQTKIAIQNIPSGIFE